MASSHVSGPFHVYGKAAAGATTGLNKEAGPSAFYQGTAIPDPRAVYSPGTTGMGAFRALPVETAIRVIDQIPATYGTARVAALQLPTASTALTLATANATGITRALGLQPFGVASSGVVTVVGLDAGRTQGDITTLLKAVTNSSTIGLAVGQPIWIAGAGVGGAPHYTTITAISSSTAFTVADAAVTTVTNATIGFSNDAGTGADVAGVYGGARIVNPGAALARGVSITATATTVASGTFTVAGYDIFGVPMTEAIALVPSAGVTAYGKKAFKYVKSVTPNITSTTARYSVGTSDLFGFGIRTDKWEDVQVKVGATGLTTSAGFVAAVTTAATATTGDTRGTIQVGTIGPATSAYATGGPSDGSLRIWAVISPTPSAVYSATPDDASSLFGVTQA